MPTGTSTTSRPSGRPRGADTAARREDILRVAAELFSVDGYRGTSMSRVAKAAGISHTGLVHHFPTKDDLLGAVMDRRDELDTARAFADAGARPTGWDYLHAMVQMVRNNEEHPGMVRLFTTVSGEAVDPEHPANAWLRRHHEATVRRLRNAFQQAAEAGQLAPDAPLDAMCRLIVAAMDGLQTQWLTGTAPGMADELACLVEAFEARWRR
ncbi:TetR family transcriptional regulator [Kocuria varians]|uniref:TetR family transcriptional regulator n=1 Tax=Kocuria varians TaxID=1272 RepID=A0A4Y4DBG3_KOCVA|nr:TetR/AcrR family transcriptional regulator [Kocuria varians]GED00101.1 TetR family transcriptional regulator [Kocuria varians]